MNTQPRRYKYRTIYTWTPELAYVAGLIAADGCLYNDGRHISLTSMDDDLLELVIHLLGLSCEVKRKSNGRGGLCGHIQFSDVALYDFFIAVGITPAKSKTILQVTVPDKLYASFLRGYFDGDGSVWGFWDQRWRSSLMYYTSYTSASRSFLVWLQTKNTELADVGPATIGICSGAFSLRYAKADSLKLFKFMYPADNATVPGLLRKYLKFVDFLASDPYASKAL